MEKKEEVVLYQGKGCPNCDNTGYKGRVAIYELLVPNPEIFEMIMVKASAEQIKNALSKTGMKTLLDDGLEKVREGITTIDEVMRVTML